jgi:cytidine deaminase
MANEPSDSDLVDRAAALLNPRRVGDRLFGDVASVLVTKAGNQFGGVCIDTPSGTGFCAEHAAVAAMVTAGEYHITRIVAVCRGEDGVLYVLPPCGRCRAFIQQIDAANLDAQVILGRGTRAALRELLPHTEWPEPY